MKLKIIKMLCLGTMAFGQVPLWGTLPQQAAPERIYAGSDSCKTCHEELFLRYQGNVHFKAADQRRLDARGSGCEACHGASAAHAEDPANTGGLITFGKGREAQSNEACLTCHRVDGKVGAFSRTTHGRRQVACNDCHASPHREVSVLPLRTAFRNEDARYTARRHLKSEPADLCLSCHADVRGRLSMPYRHPVHEQALSCSSCHDPHQENRNSRQKQRNDTCRSCHQDKRGPWAYEHSPVAEDCLSCHESHGSVAPRLLKTAQPFLCLSCHSLADDRHGVEIAGAQVSRAIYDRCTSCHGAIHGSHEDRHLKK